MLALLALADLFKLALDSSLQNLFLILGLSANFLLFISTFAGSESFSPNKHLHGDHNPPNIHFNRSQTAVPTVAHGEQHLQHVAVTKNTIRTTTVHAVIVTVEDTLPISFRLTSVTLYSFMSLRCLIFSSVTSTLSISSSTTLRTFIYSLNSSHNIDTFIPCVRSSGRVL